MERLNRELQEVKRKYFVQKRKDTLLRELEGDGEDKAVTKLAQAQQDAARQATKKFAGGGYAIK